jgi:HSP20 family molecular chaperone IbpA
MMVHKKDDQPLDLNVIDKWLETFFLDPFTSYLDETIFRIDLFETAEEFIIEALLPEYKKDEVSVLLEEDKVLIEALQQRQQNGLKQRMISFPFSIVHHHVKATFESGILEVFISKNKESNGKKRVIHFYN